jgi:hypothetical protein
MAWTNQLPNDHDQIKLQLLRVKAGGSIRGIILSPHVNWTETHFFKGRTTIHAPQDCAACENGQKPRWYGYLAILSTSSDTIALVEVTPATNAEFADWERIHATIRGAGLTLLRHGKRANGRIEAQLREPTIATRKLPDAPDVIKTMERIFEVNHRILRSPLDQTRHTTSTEKDNGR